MTPQPSTNGTRRLLFWIAGALFSLVVAQSGINWGIFHATQQTQEEVLRHHGEDIAWIRARVGNHQDWLKAIDEKLHTLIERGAYYQARNGG